MPLIVAFQKAQRSMQKRSNECQNEAGNEQRLSSHGEARPRTSDISSEEDNRNRERGLKDDFNAVRPNAGKRRHSEDDPPSEKKKRKHAADANTEDEEMKLIETYNKKKDIIIADVEPLLLFEDDRTLQREFGTLHKELQDCRSGREDRILTLIGYVDRMQYDDKLKILAAMCTKYKSILKDDEAVTDLASGYTSPQEPMITQMEIDRFPTQSTTPHEGYDERLATKVAEVHIENAARFQAYGTDEINECVKQFKRAYINSLILKFCGFSRNEIQKLKRFCYSEMARLWVFSVLDEFSVDVLNSKDVTEATFEVFTDDAQMKFEEIDCGCFCVIDQLCIQKYTEGFRQIVNEIQTEYIQILIESKMLSDDLTSALERINKSDNDSNKQQQILDLLLQDDLPGVCYCMLENTIKALGGNLDIIHNIMQEPTPKKDNDRRECIKFIGLSNKGEENLKDRRHTDKLNQNQRQALKCALVSSFGDMVDELEPLLLLKYLEKEDAKKLQPVANKAKRRHERVMIFLQQVFKDETNELVLLLIDAMKLHYQNVVKTVLDVLENGSKCEHYRCPKLKGPVLVYSTNITLLDPGKNSIELKTKTSSKLPTRKDPISETEKMRVCLVKVYSLMKEEMDRTTVNSIAFHLKQHGVISESELQTMTECSRRREGVDRLLKKVLGGSTSMHEEFRLALKRDMPYLAEALESESASGSDIKKFTLLEEGRRSHQQPRILLTQRQLDILLKNLDNENKLCQFNDHLLSTLTFSISEHTAVEVLPFNSRAQKLIDTLMTCSPMAFLQLCGTLLKIGLPKVAERLMTSDDGHTKEQDPSQTANEDYQFLEPSLEEMVVSVITRSRTAVSRQSSRPTKTQITMRVLPSDTDLQEYTKNIGFTLEDANRESSIVLSLSPKGENSWHILEMNCRTGKIKDFIPAVFNNISTDFFKEGQYRLKLTIYALPSSKEPWMENAYICLENESEKKSEEMRDFFRVLHEELEVTDGLLKRLKDEEIIDETILEKMSSIQRRSQKVECVLKEIMSIGIKGFEVLKESIKETNKYLYNYIVKKEQVHSFTDLFGSTAHKAEKEIFFTCTVILSVKRKETSGDPGCSKTDLEISCPKMIDPVFMFKDKGKISKSDRKTPSTESSFKESKSEMGEGKAKTDNPKVSTSNRRPEEEGKSIVGEPEKDVSKETTLDNGVSVGSDKESAKSKRNKGERKAK